MEVNLVNTIFTCMKSSGPRQPFLRIETTDDLTLENWHAAQQNLGNSSPNELLPRLEIVRGGEPLTLVAVLFPLGVVFLHYCCFSLQFHFACRSKVLNVVCEVVWTRESLSANLTLTSGK